MSQPANSTPTQNVATSQDAMVSFKIHFRCYVPQQEQRFSLAVGADTIEMKSSEQHDPHSFAAVLDRFLWSTQVRLGEKGGRRYNCFATSVEAVKTLNAPSSSSRHEAQKKT
jgi:hypothetical protein